MEKADSLLVQRIGHSLKDKGWVLSSAESCTGGLAAHVLTNVSGSSEWFAGGVVAYADRIKQELLGVDERILTDTGAVSRDTVEAMAGGVVRRFNTQVGLAVSGIAGPSGGSPEKPVGTVWMAWSVDGEISSRCHHFTGDRGAVKIASARAVLQGLDEILSRK